jgi:inositol transport system ATP-binding protein
MVLLELTDICKVYPGVVALDHVPLSVEYGEVHALLGENGAGKSTLLGILAGARRQDSGTIMFRGRLLPQQSPYERQREGIATIYQEFNLLPNMSVADNIFLGREPVRHGLIDRRRMRAEAQVLLDRLELSIDPAMEVRDLSVAEQQMVEITKALAISADIVVMDEPTAALSDREVGELHRLIGDLRRSGIGIIYVTHRLAEVWEICDRYTVLRDGKFAGTGLVASVGVRDIIRLMVGRDVEVQSPVAPNSVGEIVLNVQGIAPRPPNATRARQAGAISLPVRRGEILGIAGLVGAGRTEVARAIFGADEGGGGQITIDGRDVRIASPAEAIKSGVAFVPEDRKQQGLFLAHSVKNNFSLPNLRQFVRWGLFISERREEEALHQLQKSLRIRMSDSSVAVGTLSGGNQQKVILARCIALSPKVLIVDEPTRGIDVRSKSEIHQLLADLAAKGVAIIVISSELPEIMAISHRIIALREGRITGEVIAASTTEEALMTLMTATPEDLETDAVQKEHFL